LNITVDKSAEDVGLALMLADLIRQNVEKFSERKRDFDKLMGIIALEVTDADVLLTLDFQGGCLIVNNGIKGDPDIKLATDSTTLLELNNAKLRFGLLDVTHPTGMTIIKKILSGEIYLKGSGLLKKPMFLVRLTRLLSVSR
jgi:hypothetical protein